MKKLLTLLILGIFLVGFVSAFEFDNVKTYDEVTREVTIINAYGLGDTIGKAKLNTPLNVQVSVGYQKVAEFEISAYQDYSEAMKQFSFTNMKTKNKINRDYDLKYKTYEDVLIDDYDNVLVGYTENGTAIFAYQKVGEHYVTQEKWIKLTPADLKKNDILTIGVFTEVQHGDFVDWVPLIYGVEILEWATWTEDLNVDLVSYYKLDETSGTVIDSHGINNGNNTGATTNQTGKINTSYSFDGSGDMINFGDIFNFGTSPFSIQIWFKTSSTGSYKELIGKSNSTGTNEWEFRITNGNILQFLIFSSGAVDNLLGTSTVTDGNWHHAVITRPASGGNITMYLDGIVEATATNNNRNHNNTQNMQIGETSNGLFDFTGNIDEVGFWNRTISADEVFQLNNGGDGLAYGVTPPTVTLNSPPNASTFGINELITFNATISGETPLNVSLYFDGIINETNTSGLLSDYIFTKSFSNGSHNWTIESCNANGCNDDTRYLTINTIPQIAVLSPSNQTYSTSTIWFNATANTGVSRWIVNYNGTNVTLSNINTSLTIEDGQHHLFLYANNSVTGEWGLNDSIYFKIDTINPTVTITSPISFDYLSQNNNLTLNFTAIDTNLQSCIWNYNNTNNTISCISGSPNVSYFNYQNGINNGTLFINDSAGNKNNTLISWNVKIINNSITFNLSSYETVSETFTINLTANSSLTSVKLVYNGTEYTPTSSGNVYSYTLNIPTTSVGNNSIRWKFTYAGDTIYSGYSYQNINPIIFTLCNSTYNLVYLNLTFKDESISSRINASIPTSTFVYWLGDGTVNKTLTYINNTENNNYSFCFYPQNKTLNVDSRIQYESTGYPQRIYNPSTIQYTNSTTNKTLYLLADADGIYVTFQVINLAEQTISGVTVNATRTIESETVVVGDGITGASGSVTFWLNPNFEHEFTFTKTGYDTQTLTETPTQTSYTIILGGTTEAIIDYSQGISKTIYPNFDFLDNGTVYNFNLTLASTYWTVEEFGITLRYKNGTTIGTNSSTGNGGILSINNVNVTYIRNNESKLFMDYYYIINSTYINNSRTWIIQSIEGRAFSIWYFFTDLTLYIDSGNFFGFDDFGRVLLSIIVLVMVSGGLSLRYGIKSDAFVIGVIFGLVLILDVGLNFFPPIEIGNNPAIEHFVTFIVLIVLIGVMIAEERI